jgi:lipoate-protein ligase A
MPSKFEITHNGKKLIGSAQTRRKNILLQHGTLPLYGDLKRIIEVLKFKDDQEKEFAGERLLHRATTLHTAGLDVITWDETADAFEMGFEQALNLKMEQSELSAHELERAEWLMKEKYGQSAWTEHISSNRIESGEV